MKNIRQTRIFLVSILIISIVTVIGFSTWLISDSINIKPSPGIDKVITRYLSENEGTYDGNVLLPSSEAIGLVNNGRNTDLQYKYKKANSTDDYINCEDSNQSVGPIDAGDYLIEVTYIINETESETISNIKFKINPLDISNCDDILISFTEHSDNKFIYTGNEIKPDDLQVKYKQRILAFDNDYTVNYLNNINVTTEAVVQVIGQGNFKGTKQLYFEISDQPRIIYLKATNGINQVITYDGTQQKPEIKAYSDEACTNLLDDVNLTYSFTPINANDNPYSIIVYANKTNYEEAYIDISLKIEPKELNLNWYKSDNYTYNGQSQGPTCLADNIIEGDRCDITSTKEINAGDYVASIISVSNSNYKLPINNLTCNFIINKANYKCKTIGKLNFDGDYYIEGNQLNVSGYVLTDIFGNEISCAQEADISQTKFTDGNSETVNANVSIICSAITKDSNYNDYITSTSVVVYAVATIGSKYYGTVERALTNAVSGNEVYLIPNRNPTLRENAEVKSNVTLYLVYQAGKFLDNRQNSVANIFAESQETKYLQNTLTIEKSIVLINNGTIKIDGITGNAGAIYAGQTSGSYTQIVMNESSSIKNTGVIYCLGFIKESYNENNSIIYIQSGTLTAPLVFYDFKGGSVSNYLNGKKVFPMKVFDMPNIRPLIRITQGAKYEAITDIYMNNKHFNQQDLYVIGTSSDSNALLKMTSGYIDLKYNTTGTPTINSGYHDFNIYGNCETGKLKVNLAGTDVSTENFYCPMSWKFKINIYNSMTIKSKFEFLPGSSLIINKNATLQIDKDCCFYQSYKDKGGQTPLYPNINNAALLKINGVCKINANFCGRIVTEVSGAQLYVSNNNLTGITDGSATAKLGGFSGDMVYAQCGDVTLNNATLYAYGCFENSTDFSQKFSSNAYYLSNGDYWSNQVSSGEFNVIYHYKDLDGNDQSQTITYNIFSGITPTIPLISDPIRRYYNFDGWFTDESYSYSYDTINVSANGTYNIYAKYSPIEYTLIYEDLSDNIKLDNVTFTYENYQNIIIANELIDGKTFIGWYITKDWTDSDIAIPAGSTGQAILRLIEQMYNNNINALTLYGKYDIMHKIQFNIGLEEFDFDDEYVSDGGTISKINAYSNALRSLESNDTQKMYFVEWIDSDNNVITSNTIITKDMILTAKLQTKAHTITFTGGNEDDIRYSNTTDSYIIPIEAIKSPTGSKDKGDTEVEYNFVNWLCENDGTNYNKGDSIAINSNLTFTAKFTESTYCYISASTTSETITKITIGNEEISQSGGYWKVLQNSSITVTVTHKNTGNGSSQSFSYDDGSTHNLTGNTNGVYNFTITKNTEITASSSDGCIIEGTLITLADGTKKKIEELQFGDLLLTWDFFTGSFDVKPLIALEKTTRRNFEVLNIYLDNGYKIQVISAQSFFDMNLREYFEINLTNYESAIGKRIMIVDDDKISSSKISTIQIEEIETVAYELITAEDFNFVANDILTIEPFIFWVNTFKIDENYRYNIDQFNKDVEKYGLYEYEEWSDYLTKEEFEAFNGKYFKVAVGKGLITKEYILKALSIYKNSYKH